MIIQINNQTRVLNGSVRFLSAFRHKNKKISGRAFKALRDGMAEKGYYVGGEKPFPFEMPEIPKNPTEEDFSNMWGVLSSMVGEFASMTSAFCENKKSYDYYENPETGDIITLKSVIVATDLWPLEEVLELVPDLTI